MKIRTSSLAFTVSALFATALIGACPAQAQKCTRDQAMNKMMAIGRVQTRLVNHPDAAAQRRADDLTREVAAVGSVLAAGKYEEACRRYDEIAKKYQIDLKAESQGLVTMEQIKKDGGKKSGSCSQTDAHKRLMGYYAQLQDRVANGDADQSVIRDFARETGPLGELMYTNPSEVCRRLDGLKPKYELK